MVIKNFTQFAVLITNKQVVHMNAAFDRLVTCMMLYNGMCSCGGNTDRDKASKHGECNRIYREALGAVENVKAYLFQGCQDNTISFFIDETHHVKTLCR